MKIIAILENDLTIGGCFNQALNAIIQMEYICKGHFDFQVFTSKHENIIYLKKLGLEPISFSFSIIDKLLALLSLASWWHFIQKWLKFVGPFEKKLIKYNCDLVYFLTQSSSPAILQKLNYITTVFDLCHRDMPEFPEVNSFNEFRVRERHFQNNLSPAVLILTASDQLSDKISRRYGIDHERCLSMPFSPSPFFTSSKNLDKFSVFNKYHLEEGYFFYPAQFWAHKNHIRILESLIILREKGVAPKVVFAGGDQGNFDYIKKFVTCHALSNQVRFLGFVPVEDMHGLYKGCSVVLMPTYFGPTNLPPLEAWLIGKPLIYSSHLKEQVSDAAICVDPDNAQELADAMYICTCAKKQAELIELGKLQLERLNKQREKAEKELLTHIAIFETRRKCWQ